MNIHYTLRTEELKGKGGGWLRVETQNPRRLDGAVFTQGCDNLVN